MAVVVVTLPEIAAGWVIVAVEVLEHPALSVMVTVYVPAAKPVAVGELPAPPDHEYVKLPVPPEPAAVALPVLAPLQLMFVCDEMLAVGAPAFPIVTVVVAVQPFPSVPVTVYVEAAKPVADAALPPEGDQLYEYPEPTVPPEAATVAVPVLPPQAELVDETNDTETAVAG